MADVKNFGLIGVGSSLQFGKASSKIINTAGNFNFRAADGTTPVALSGAGITSSAGNVTLTTGNVVLSSNSGVVTLGDAGSLGRLATGVYSFSGTGAVAMPAGDTASRPAAATAAGMFRYNSSTSGMEFSNGSVWAEVGSSGDVAALQTEVDNIETSLGSAIETDGTFNGAAFTDSAAGAASFTAAINQVAAAAAGKDTLEEIEPVLAIGNIIYADSGSTWAQALPGATSGVQAYDAGLAALAAKTTTGILVQTGANTYDSRTLVAPAAGITITNEDGVSGNPTFALANDLAGLEGLATTGYSVRTGDGTWTTREISGTAGRIVVTNGTGVASNTDVDLATVTDSATGTFLKVTVDTYGRVTGTTAVVTADITTLVDGTYVNTSGDTMSGNLNMGGTNKITGLAEPTASSDAATKNYVDNAVTGLSWKQAVHVLSSTDVPLTGGATLTIDSVSVANGDRILLTGQTDPYENGIYTAAGIGSTYTLTRSSDADAFAELNGAAVFVQTGTVYADSGWVQTATLTSLTTGATQAWQQFSGAGSYSAGDGLLLTGTVFSVNMGAGITTLPSDEVGLDIVANKAVQLTSTATGGQLTFVLDTGSGLEQSATGLKISAAGVTNAMLVNDGFTLNGDSGTPNEVSLGDTLLIAGTSVQGISTAVTADTITITAANASSSQKGVASFTTGEFVVTAGNVAVGVIGNANLANSAITFTGTSGTDAVALGESMAIIGADSMITTTMGTNSLTIQLGTVDVAHGGTGRTSLTTGQILFGAGTSAVGLDADLAFDTSTNTLTIGTSTISAPAGGELTISSTFTDADINLIPNGTGSVVVGSSGPGFIQSDAGESLTIIGTAGLVLESGAGDTTMTLPSGTGSKVTISGPTASDYATGLAANDLANKQYVDDAIATGASSGAVKVVKATISLAAAGSFDVGADLPAGASILSVKVQVTAADTGSGTLAIGKAGGSQYMTASENDTQTIGMYIAETYVVEAGSEQVQATVAGTPAGSGSAIVIVEYQVA